MLEIILLILKIAGIILVSVLGILIVLIGLTLLFSVRCRGDFSVSDAGDGEEKKTDTKVCMQVKYLFFTLWDTEKDKTEKNKKKEKKRKQRKEKRKGRAENSSSGKEEQSADWMKEDVSGEADKQKDIPLSGGDKGKAPSDTEENNSEADRKKDAKSGIPNILQTIRSFCDKLKEIRDKAERAEELWISDHMVKSRDLLGKELAYLLKHMKLKNLSGYLRFGFDDPSLTGYAMALYGILYAIWNPKLSVEPDFEKQVLDCHVLIKGKVRVWHLVRVVLRLFLSKDVRRVIADVKKFNHAPS